ncbi:hypothetical protein Dimus_016538 [Dionaea muscipula]
MGAVSSTSTPEPPASTTATPNSPSQSMAAAPSPATGSPKLQPKSQNPDPKAPETPAPDQADQSEKAEGKGQSKEASEEVEGGEEGQAGEEGGGEEEEEGECGFCLFMKAGGCRESFVAWEKCVEEADTNEEDIVEKCHVVTAKLHKCMEAHSDYYAPILKVEKEVEEVAEKELELENERKKEKETGVLEQAKGPESSKEQGRVQ